MQFQENTAYYRASASQFARDCNWAMAAQQLAKAIEIYPSNGGALAQKDLQQMQQRLASYQRFAVEAA